MKRYEFKFLIDLKEDQNPDKVTNLINNFVWSESMLQDESVVPGSIEITEVPIPELPT